jgi:hypothetical protein
MVAVPAMPTSRAARGRTSRARCPRPDGRARHGRHPASHTGRRSGGDGGSHPLWRRCGQGEQGYEYNHVPATKLPPTAAAPMTVSTTPTPALQIAFRLKSGFDVDPDGVPCTPRDASLDLGDRSHHPGGDRSDRRVSDHRQHQLHAARFCDGVACADRASVLRDGGTRRYSQRTPTQIKIGSAKPSVVNASDFANDAYVPLLTSSPTAQNRRSRASSADASVSALR